MANYIVTDTDLTAVADAIRDKGGTADSLVFPGGFVEAVGDIETGGGATLEPLSVTPSLSAQTITPESGVDGFDEVDVASITKELLALLDADFVAGNIKKDVDLFGLIGSFEGGGAKTEYGTFVAAEDIRSGTTDIALTSVSTPKFIVLYRDKDSELPYNSGMLYALSFNTPNGEKNIGTVSVRSYTSDEARGYWHSNATWINSGVGFLYLSSQSDGWHIRFQPSSITPFRAGTYRWIIVEE